MAQELIYTSTPRGLKLGSSGFCTVACTRGMAPNYIETLESLSGYTPVFPPNHPRAEDNPVGFSHYRFVIGGKPVSVLSRVAAAGVDYTKRPNKFAHHLALDARELSAGGPAWVMQQPGIFVDRWEGDPMFLDQPSKIPAGNSSPAPCRAWGEQLGDAGWAGVLAQAFLDDEDRPSFVIFKPGMPVLALITEAIGLLPIERRWDVTFSTYFMFLPARTTCSWRCCLAGSRILKQARRMPDALVLDLDAGDKQGSVAQELMASGSSLIARARSGAPPPVSADAAEKDQRREDERLQMVPEEGVAKNSGGKRPRSPAAVWLESARRKPEPPKRSAFKIALYTLTVALLILLAVLIANMFLSSSDNSETMGEDQNPANSTTGENNEKASDSASANEMQRKLQADIESLQTENIRLKNQLASQEKHLAKVTKELDEVRKQFEDLQQQREIPSHIVCLGQLEVMEFDNKGEYVLPVPAITSEGKVTHLDWSNSEDEIAREDIQQRDAALVILTQAPFNDKADWVIIDVKKGEGIRFRKSKDVPEQNEKSRKLKKIAWIVLELDGRTVTVQTRERPIENLLLE